jgi:disulfide bond formation protein DsbB
MNYLSNITTSQKPWLLLAITAIALELSALFFQYAMGLAPCIMCVYQRLAIFSIFTAGVIGLFGYHSLLLRALAYLFWGIGSIWGLIIALEHVEMQANSGSLFFSCELVPNFPEWAPLHEWLPFLFEATGDCGEISWQFVGFSMPQWMVVVFTAYTAVLALIVINRLIIAKKL